MILYDAICSSAHQTIPFASLTCQIKINEKIPNENKNDDGES